MSLEPLWLAGSLLVSSTLGLAEKRGQEEEGEAGGREEGKEGGRKRDVNPFPGPQLSLTTWKWSLMEQLGTQAPDCPTHVPVGSCGRSPGTQK